MNWRPKFYPSAATITSTLVWVRFPRIYPEMLDEEILSSMGDLPSRTVKVDSTSLTGLRWRFARVCVEINLGAPLLPSLTVFDGEQKVDYEGLHLICFECGCYGHLVDKCPSLVLPTDPNVASDTHPVDGISDPIPPPSSVPKSIYGLLMLYGNQRWKQATNTRLGRHPTSGKGRLQTGTVAL